MARRWTADEEATYRKELIELYELQNKSIREVGDVLGISESSVFVRMKRLGIASKPERKPKYRNQRSDVQLPKESVKLAEFLGVMLGDGHVSHFQVLVTLGTKEYPYVLYVQSLMEELFAVSASISEKRSGYHDVYIGSTKITSWLKSMGLVSNKVACQVGVPAWIESKPEYMEAFVRGFFDTDGSIYRLRFGMQISLTNHSVPLLIALQSMLKSLGYGVSEISAHRVYITRRGDVVRFFKEIRPMNTKHRVRFENLASVAELVNCTRL